MSEKRRGIEVDVNCILAIFFFFFGLVDVQCKWKEFWLKGVKLGV